MKKLLLLLLLIFVFAGCEKEAEIVEDKATVKEEYAEKWTIEMTVSEVTPTSLKWKLTHKGDRIENLFGGEFFIEKLTDGEWTEVPALCEPMWQLIAYHIPHNGSYEFEENFEWLYGVLPEGHYRIGKEVTVEGEREGVYAPVKFSEDIIYYAEFDI